MIEAVDSNTKVAAGQGLNVVTLEKIESQCDAAIHFLGAEYGPGEFRYHYSAAALAIGAVAVGRHFLDCDTHLAECAYTGFGIACHDPELGFGNRVGSLR
jgi:hypothetical protein